MAKKIGSFRGTFAGLRQDFMSGEIEAVFKVHKDYKAQARTIADGAVGLDLNVSIEKHAEKRSLDSNAYFWTLCGKLAAVLGISMEGIYKEYIRGIGDNFEIVPIRDDAKEQWIKNWAGRGIGWICEDLGMGKISGYSNILCYYGSSTYDSHQMHRLIEMLIFDCKEQGVETLSPDKLELMMNEWTEKSSRESL